MPHKRAPEAIALREEGLTFKDIGAKMGISLSYAQALVSDPTGERQRERNRKWSKKQKQAAERPYDPALTTAGKAGIEKIICCSCGRPLAYYEEPMAFACPALWAVKGWRWRIGVMATEHFNINPEHVTCLPIEALNPAFRVTRKARRWREGDHSYPEAARG